MPAQRLPWIKFWPEAVEHEKFAVLTDPESWSWVVVWAKASLQPTRWRFASVEHAHHVTGRPARHIRRLVEVGLLDEGPDGLLIHDAKHWQDVSNIPPSQRERPSKGDRTVIQPLPKGELEGEGEVEREVLPKAKAFSSADADRPPTEDPPDFASIDAVYDHFKTKIQPKSRLCPRKKIAARLKRFTVDELREGIDHFADDWWWMKHNGGQGAEWFFESDKRSEQFLLLVPRKETPDAPPVDNAAQTTDERLLAFRKFA